MSNHLISHKRAKPEKGSKNSGSSRDTPHRRGTNPAASGGLKPDSVSQLLRRLEKTWTAFNESFAGLSDERLLEPGVADGWSVKDILAHVTTWEEEALKHLPVIITGGRPPRYATAYGGIDAFNARMTAQKRDLSLAEVRQQLDDTHRQLIVFIQSAPAGQLTGQTRARRRLRLDTYSHYPIHTTMIRAWRQQRGLG